MAPRRPQTDGRHAREDTCRHQEPATYFTALRCPSDRVVRRRRPCDRSCLYAECRHQTSVKGCRTRRYAVATVRSTEAARGGPDFTRHNCACTLGRQRQSGVFFTRRRAEDTCAAVNRDDCLPVRRMRKTAYVHRKEEQTSPAPNTRSHTRTHRMEQIQLKWV